jgi:formylglycine-generating enzyme required for sulfatase activity
MEFIHLPANQVEIAASPVLHSHYQQNGIIRIPTPTGKTPITNVSASEASAFAARMGARLPIYEEITEFLDILKRGGKNLAYLSSHIEWLNCSPNWAVEGLKLNCIASIDKASVARGSFMRGSIQDQGYPFVTFRLVRPLNTKELFQ